MCTENFKDLRSAYVEFNNNLNSLHKKIDIDLYKHLSTKAHGVINLELINISEALIQELGQKSWQLQLKL